MNCVVVKTRFTPTESNGDGQYDCGEVIRWCSANGIDNVIIGQLVYDNIEMTPKFKIFFENKEDAVACQLMWG